MAIFSRRTLQRLINENAQFMRKGQLSDHVERLNRNDEFSLDAEWEVVLLNAFSKVGGVRHEPKFPGPKKPDIHFISVSDPHQEFIADIATISDRGLEKQNPIQHLYQQMIDIIKKLGLRANSFSMRAEGNSGEIFREGAKPRLKIPTQPKFEKDVFNEKFYGFLDEISKSPNEQRGIRIKNSDTDIAITYNPAQRFAGLSHLSFKQITSLIQNTVYNRLEEKVGKLTGAEYKAPLAVILCDGGCSYLGDRHHPTTYGIDDVIRYFLNQYPEISFVLTFFVEQHFGHGAYRKVIPKLYKGKSFPSIGANIVNCIGKLVEVLPIAERNAVNAVNYLSLRPNEGNTFIGGLEVSNNEIKISARVLLDLLAGRITQEDFFKAYKFGPGEEGEWPSSNPFLSELKQGKLITEIKVEKTEDERDDDWLAIRFSGPDPAIFPFVVPKAAK